MFTLFGSTTLTIFPFACVCLICIVHGIEDYVVTVDYSEKAAVLYKDCTLKEIHGDHGFNTEESFAECKKLTLEWLTR